MTDNILSILADFDIIDLPENEAQASSIVLNPNVSWAKFIFTDDQPNGNNKRVPLEEFQNIVRTGVHMPIKMRLGQIDDGHDEAVALGTIAQLKIEGNKVLGLAALWLAERPDDIKLLKDKNQTESKPQISWELFYGTTRSEESGITALSDVCVKAATIVGIPAYKGRTPILAMASESSKNTEETNVEENEKLTQRITELVAEIESLHKQLTDKDTSTASMTTELETLREFKASIDKKQAEDTKFASIKQKFTEAKIEKPAEYFDTNRDKLLALDESALDFMLQEMVAFSSVRTETSSTKTPAIPNIQPPQSVSLNPKELAAELIKIGFRK